MPFKDVGIYFPNIGIMLNIIRECRENIHLYFNSVWFPTHLIWLGARRKWKHRRVTPIVFVSFLSGFYLSKAVYRMETRTLQMFDYTQSHFRAIDFGEYTSESAFLIELFCVLPHSVNLSCPLLKRKQI